MVLACVARVVWACSTKTDRLSNSQAVYGCAEPNVQWLCWTKVAPDCSCVWLCLCDWVMRVIRESRSLWGILLSELCRYGTPQFGKFFPVKPLIVDLA